MPEPLKFTHTVEKAAMAINDCGPKGSLQPPGFLPKMEGMDLSAKDNSPRAMAARMRPY